MKRIKLFLAALMVALMAQGSASAATVTVAFTYAGDTISQWDDTPSFGIYLKGYELAFQDYPYDGKWVYQLDVDDMYVGQSVSYTSSLGHKGKITIADGLKISLECKKLNVTTKNSQDYPMSWQEVYIYDEDNKDFRLSTNYEGKDSIYLNSGNYSYRWREEYGSFSLTDDYELNLKEKGGQQPSSSVRLYIKSRYGDFPYEDYNKSASLYEAGNDDDNYRWMGINGSTDVEPGSYYIKDGIGIKTDPFVVTKDTTIWFDYHKVTFNSKTGNNPNKSQDIEIYTNPDDYNNERVTTNANGSGTIYLLAGQYCYNTAGITGTFTVGNEDQTVNISTSKVVITLNCDDPDLLGKQSFYWTDGENFSNSAQPLDGKIICYGAPGKYKLIINNICSEEIEMQEGENAKTIQLYSLQFTSNQTSGGKMSVEISDDLDVSFGRKVLLTAGTYDYRVNYASERTEFELSQNKEIALNFCKLTITATDNEGPVEDEWIGIAGRYYRTDDKGQVEATLPYGDYKITCSESDEDKQVTLSTAESSVDFTVRPYVVFRMTYKGRPMNDILDAYCTETGDFEIIVENGIAKSRLIPGKAYEIEDYYGTTTITAGCAIDLGVLQVTTDGMGIAFPMENWEAVSEYDVIVGSTVRLTAIPVSGETFNCWDINGVTYQNGMIDVTIPASVTKAKAVFGGGSQTQIRQSSVNTSFQFDDNYIYLPSAVQGEASIYAADGKLTKNLGILGDKIGIADLPEGNYIIVLSCGDEPTQVARFNKK